MRFQSFSSIRTPMRDPEAQRRPIRLLAEAESTSIGMPLCLASHPAAGPHSTAASRRLSARSAMISARWSGACEPDRAGRARRSASWQISPTSPIRFTGGVPAMTPILLALELGIVETGHPRELAARHDQCVGRTVIGVGVLHALGAGGRADDEVAQARAEGVADESGTLRQPVIADLDLEFVGDDLRDPVLEAVLLAVGERHVARVAADAQDVRGHEIGQCLRDAALAPLPISAGARGRSSSGMRERIISRPGTPSRPSWRLRASLPCRSDGRGGIAPEARAFR